MADTTIVHLPVGVIDLREMHRQTLFLPYCQKTKLLLFVWLRIMNFRELNGIKQLKVFVLA